MFNNLSEFRFAQNFPIQKFHWFPLYLSLYKVYLNYKCSSYKIIFYLFDFPPFGNCIWKYNFCQWMLHEETFFVHSSGHEANTFYKCQPLSVPCSLSLTFLANICTFIQTVIQLDKRSFKDFYLLSVQNL